jgi:hypothetical protein
MSLGEEELKQNPKIKKKLETKLEDNISFLKHVKEMIDDESD